MNSISNTHIRIAAPAAIAAGAALVASAVLRITDEPSGETTVVGFAEHTFLGLLTASLVLLVPAVLLLARMAARPRLAAVPVAGMLGLAALTVVSNVRGEDPSFFAEVAIPTNLLWFGGLVAIAVLLRRGGHVPRALAIALPLTWALTLPGSAIGGAALAGAYWLAVGWLLLHDQLPLRAASPAPAVA